MHQSVTKIISCRFQSLWVFFSLTAGDRRVEWHDLRRHLRRFGVLRRRLFAGVALLHGEKQRTRLVAASRLEIRISFLSLLSPRFVVPGKPPREIKLELELTSLRRRQRNEIRTRINLLAKRQGLFIKESKGYFWVLTLSWAPSLQKSWTILQKGRSINLNKRTKYPKIVTLKIILIIL